MFQYLAGDPGEMDEHITTKSAHVPSDEELRQMDPGERHTILYKRFIIKCQRLNAMIFAFGGVIFTLGQTSLVRHVAGCSTHLIVALAPGSVFFLPQAEHTIPNKGK